MRGDKQEEAGIKENAEGKWRHSTVLATLCQVDTRKESPERWEPQLQNAYRQNLWDIFLISDICRETQPILSWCHLWAGGLWFYKKSG